VKGLLTEVLMQDIDTLSHLQPSVPEVTRKRSLMSARKEDWGTELASVFMYMDALEIRGVSWTVTWTTQVAVKHVPAM
jgi:hypothetical protein